GQRDRAASRARERGELSHQARGTRDRSPDRCPADADRGQAGPRTRDRGPAVSFETSIFFTRHAEGGDNMRVPTDLGGHTVFGISERAHPKNHPDYAAFWAAPSWPRAQLIYYRDYWEPNRVDDLPEHYQAVHFDCLV